MKKIIETISSFSIEIISPKNSNKIHTNNISGKNFSEMLMLAFHLKH